MASARRGSGIGALTKPEIAERWPEAVEFARQFREVFGDGVKLTYAKNCSGETIGRPSESQSSTPSTNGIVSTLAKAIDSTTEI